MLTTNNTKQLTRKKIMAKETKKQPARSASPKGASAKVAKVLGEFKAGTLHGGVNPKGPKKAPVVKSRQQAVAIALSEAGIKKKKGAKSA
jgi:hypothetical protein